MDQARVPIAREGWPFILAPAVLAEVLALAGWGAWALAAFAAALFSAWFFRDPERYHTPREGLIVSPADGKVIHVGQVEAAPLSGEPALKVSIFMSVVDVHVNRSPVTGRVTAMDYTAGKFFNASLDKASESNERLILALETDGGSRVEVAQIAGLIARRIVCYAKPGDELTAGQRFGLIRFGSRVDLYLPTECRLNVGLGQRVKAGQDVVGRL